MRHTFLFIFSLLVSAALSAKTEKIELPTMGWSSWNTYRVNISDSLIMSQADACVRRGLKAAGYTYINIDDGFFGGRDMKTGRLKFHPTRFPNGLKPVVKHIHSLGLKAGIYSDAGANTCGNWYDKDTIGHDVGLYGHDQQDIDMYFCELGFDFIKIDFCGGNPTANSKHLDLDPKERYTTIAQAIRNTGRKDVRMNVCRWDYPGNWVRDVALSWRMSQDIRDRWASVKDIISQNLYLSAYAGGGHYNDMDMLEVGRSLKPEEDRTHFAMWCMMASPLLIGCDLNKIKPETLELLTNPHLIAIDQDPLGLQAYVAKHDMKDDTYVLVKDMEQKYGTKRAVALYNPTDAEKVISISLQELELQDGADAFNVFDNTTLYLDHQLTATVAPHSTIVYVVKGGKRLARTLYEAESAYLGSYQELYNEIAVGTAYYVADSLCSGGMKVTNLGYRPDNDLRWSNVYCEEESDYMISIRTVGFDSDDMLFVAANDGDGYQFRYSDARNGVITVALHMKKGENTVRLYNSKGSMPEIDWMKVTKMAFGRLTM